MFSMAVMDEMEQDLICCLFCIDSVQGKERKKLLSTLTGTSIDHHEEYDYTEANMFSRKDSLSIIYNELETRKVVFKYKLNSVT